VRPELVAEITYLGWTDEPLFAAHGLYRTARR
jgi:hypothetical protein